jgi:hypothetical protein
MKARKLPAHEIVFLAPQAIETGLPHRQGHGQNAIPVSPLSLVRLRAVNRRKTPQHQGVGFSRLRLERVEGSALALF